MRVLAILALMWVASLSSCVSHDAKAFTITQAPIASKHLDLSSPVRGYIHDSLGMPNYLTIQALNQKEVRLQLRMEF